MPNAGLIQGARLINKAGEQVEGLNLKPVTCHTDVHKNATRWYNLYRLCNKMSHTFTTFSLLLYYYIGINQLKV